MSQKMKRQTVGKGGNPSQQKKKTGTEKSSKKIVA